MPPCPETRSGKKHSLLTEPLAAQVYPRQWEVMLRLQATSAGHTWDSAAPTLVLLIQPGVSSVHSNSGGFTSSLALPAKSFQTFHPLWVSLKLYLKPQSRLVNPRTQMPAPKILRWIQWPDRTWELMFIVNNFMDPLGYPNFNTSQLSTLTRHFIQGKLRLRKGERTCDQRQGSELACWALSPFWKKLVSET